jgi:predicted GIY-YIG superfamily endonuclease
MATEGIYLIRCLITNRIYVGSSSNIEGRFNRHKRMILRKNHSSPLMHELDLNQIELKILEETPTLSRIERTDKEQKYIDDLRPELNNCKKARGPEYGDKNPMFGRACWLRGIAPEKHPLFGRKGNKHNRFGMTGDKSPVSVRVICFDDSKEFASIAEAAKFYGIKSPSNVSAVCTGRQKKTHGLSFGYVNHTAGTIKSGR